MSAPSSVVTDDSAHKQGRPTPIGGLIQSCVEAPNQRSDCAHLSPSDNIVLVPPVPLVATLPNSAGPSNTSLGVNPKESHVKSDDSPTAQVTLLKPEVPVSSDSGGLVNHKKSKRR